MERKNWKLWIVAVITMMLVCFAASAVTAEEAMITTTEPVTVPVKGGLTNEKAAEGYIRNLFQIPTETKGRNLRGVSAGSLLTGKEAIVYSILKEKIEEVARGNQPNTVFTIPIRSIYDVTEYFPGDLGVSSIFIGDNWNQEAVDAFLQITYIDYEKVVNAILLDCPYDLYWFDKTTGYRYTGIRYASYGKSIFINEEERPNITISFAVSADYSASGGTGTYVCKTSYGQSAVAAANNAQQIINDNAGKSDYQRLTAYKTRICNMVSYNTAAAGGGRDYGDPWQLVWVFDNDTSTTVVCEGYSKAFQYLCDNTKWHGDVETISVSGTMTGGTGAGRHMWNIVTMGDGKHYMADITNSDAGTVGGNGGLFLNGYTSRGEDNRTYIFHAGGKDINYTYNDDTFNTFSATGKLELAATAAPEFITLDSPSITIPEGVTAGVPVSITINGVENADYYSMTIAGPEYGATSGQQRRIDHAGEYPLAPFGLDDGDYTITLTAISNGEYENSEAAVYTLNVSGQRPAIPTIQMPTGEIHWGDTVWIEASQDNAEAIWYEVNESSEELLTQGGTAMIPVVADETADYVFRARANGAWSKETDTYTLTATMGTVIPEPGMTVPETNLQGQDVTVSGITAVPGAKVYAYSLKGPETEIYDEVFAIVYDQPFDLLDNTMTIPGYLFMNPGTYDITISAYSNRYLDFLSETVRHITVTENPELPQKPTAVWEVDESDTNIFGKSKFTITTTNGADRIYAFVYGEDDEGEVEPIAIETDPNATVYTCELINRKVGSPIASFAVYKNGFWSEPSEGVTHFVYGAEEGYKLGRVNFSCPQETVLGEDFTVQWGPVENAEWYELEVWAGETLLSTETIAATGTSDYSQAVCTEGWRYSGEYSIRVQAYAAGYEQTDSYFENIQLLDSNQRITVAGTQAPATANIVTMTLGNVTANRIRVRIDGADAGMYGVNPTNGTATLTIPITNRDGQIQVANYDTDPRKWGAWSDPVTANSPIVDPTKILYLPEDLTQIEANAFEGIDAEGVIIPDGCTEIGAGAFRNCLKLKYVSYKQGTTIANDAFERTVTDMQCPEIQFNER